MADGERIAVERWYDLMMLLTMPEREFAAASRASYHEHRGSTMRGLAQRRRVWERRQLWHRLTPYERIIRYFAQVHRVLGASRR